MREKKTRRWLAGLLTAVMLLTMIPTVAFAATGSTEDDFYKIVHLDAGRKYFTAEWIESFITEMADAGYTHLELAFGNDGLRFLLDDMSVGEYDSNAVTAAIQAGNKVYYDAGGANELTESEMDAIIAHAQEKGIEIIPLLNSPGHMDAVVAALGTLGISNAGYNGSKSTIDLTNEEAVAFTQTLVGKYAEYFAENGCTIFNMGADEYANDVYSSGSMGFGALLSAGLYGKFVSYVNDVAAIIKDAGMTPMAFNDGIYFQGNTSSGTFDSDIMISFWSSGWSTCYSASASTLASKGHKMINTHGDFYYVLGKSDNFDSGASYASNWENTQFMGSTVSDPAGAMFCIWCDYPGAETEDEITGKIVDSGVLAAMSQAMGHMPTVEEAVTMTDEATGVTVTAPGLTSVSVTVKQPAAVDGDVVSKIYTIALNGGAYTGEAQVKLPYDSAFDACSTIYGCVGTDEFDVKVEGDYFVATVPHFSDVEIVGEIDAQDADEDPVDVSVMVGNTITQTLNGHVGTDGETGSDADNKVQYTIEHVTTPTTAGTQYVLGGAVSSIDAGSFAIASGTSAIGVSDTSPAAITLDGTTSGTVIPETCVWNISSSGNNRYTISTQSNETTYYLRANKGALNLSTQSTNWSYSNGYLSTGNKNTYYLYLNDGTWSLSQDNQTAVSLYPVTTKEVTGEPQETTKVTFKGLAVGEADVQIGGTTYHVTVTDIDLSTVTPLIIEYWITNGRPTDSGNNKTLSISAGTDGVYSEAGVDITPLIPKNTTKDGRTLEFWKTVALTYTGSTDVNAGTGLQTESGGDDETASTSVFTKVRYWGRAWQVYVNGSWMSVDQTDVTVGTTTTTRTQLVAYYMEVMDIANSAGESELHINAADWGIKGNGGNWGYSPESQRVSLSVQIVYEDGSKNPSNEADATLMDSKSFIYYCGGNRGIGTVILNGQKYLIYKVTSETGTMTSTASGNSVQLSGLSWENNEMTVWEGDPAESVTISNPTSTLQTTGIYQNLYWPTAGDAILLRVYVKANVNPDDALTVHYIDRSDNSNEFYSYQIPIKEGTVFDAGFALGTEKNTLVNNTVQNYLDVTQTVQADLSKMSEIGAQYKYANFECVEAKRSEDGKDVYLYYTFSPVRIVVADFGLPIELTPSDLDATLTESIVKSVEISSASTTNKLGTVSVSGTTITYTPAKVLTTTDAFTVLVTTSSASGIVDTTSTQVAFRVYVVPASNVLYEEGFMTEKSGDYVDWAGGSKLTTSTTSTNVQSSANTAPYGYDAAYANITNVSGSAFTATGLAGSNTSSTNYKRRTNYLTVDFYGNGFDLIGTSGPNTGYVYLVLKNNDDSSANKIVVIDTSYEGETLYQVPLAHVDLALGNYTATVYGAYRAYSAPASQSDVEDVADDQGVEGADVEYVDTADNISTDAATSRTEGTTVSIDGFRVYGTSANTVYAAEEQNIGYVNALYAVNTASMAAYVEGNGAGTYEVTQYEGLGGPQNEIYLAKNQSVAFMLNASSEVQVSLRNVTGSATAKLAGETTNNIQITHATEMYYEVIPDGSGLVTITNTGDGLLAVCNFKYPATNRFVELTAADYPVMFALLDSEPVFVPESLSAETGTLSLLRKQISTLTVTTSTDVAYLEVNGKIIKPANARLVKWGLMDEYTFVVTETTKKGEDVYFDVIAYDADGMASDVYMVD